MQRRETREKREKRGNFHEQRRERYWIGRNFKFREKSRVSGRSGGSKIFDAVVFARRMGPPRRWSCPPLLRRALTPLTPSFFAFGDVHRLFRTILTRAIIGIGDTAERNPAVKSKAGTERIAGIAIKMNAGPPKLGGAKTGAVSYFHRRRVVTRRSETQSADDRSYVNNVWNCLERQFVRFFSWLDCFYNASRFNARDVEKCCMIILIYNNLCNNL